MSSHHPEEQEHASRHPTFKQYVLVATILFVITLVEFLIIVPERLQGAAITIPPLIILSALKFAIVIMFYMHLKFDSRLYTWVFMGGLALAFAVVIAVLGLFGAFQPNPRDFAEARAEPFEHGAGPEDHEPVTPAPPEGGEEPTDVPAEKGEPSGGEDLVAQGQAVFTGKGGCGACHTIQGLSTGNVGPELTHIGTEAADRQPGMSAEEYIRESLQNPSAFVVEGFPPAMPANIANTMSDPEFEALVQFLLAQE